MCRKDFTGYICGHCSLPKIIPCPITLSNPRFPLCKFIAEVPTWVETYCDPCQRVAFTHDVLLREKIHMQSHIDKKCPCGFDYTEEERQQTKARLLAEKESDKGVWQVKRSTSGTRQEAHQPRKQIQEAYSRFNDKQKSGQQQDARRYMGHMDQYLNAPYGQHPMQPVPTDQHFRPYHPQHAFIGGLVPPINQYRGKHSSFPFLNGTNMHTEPVMASGGSFVRTRKTGVTETPDQKLVEGEPVQDLPAENHATPVTEESSPNTVEFILSPAYVSSGIVPPSRPHSCPRHRPAREWDTRSVC